MLSSATVCCVLLSVFAVVTLAAPQAPIQNTVTATAPPAQDPMQSLVGAGDLSPAEQSSVRLKYAVDEDKYYRKLYQEAGYTPAKVFLSTGLPESVKGYISHRPDVFLASLAIATPLPSYMRKAPESIQDFWKSVGSQDMKMYVSEVRLVNSDAVPMPSAISVMISSQFAEATSSEAAARSAAATAWGKPDGRPTNDGGARASSIGSGRMTVAATGVLVAAALISIAML